MTTAVMSRRRTALGVAAVVAAAVAFLSGCGNVGDGGSAAIVGDTHISIGDVDAQVQEVLAARGNPNDRPSQGLVTDTVRRLVITDLVNKAAQSKGVSVTQGQVDAYYNQTEAGLGGEQAMQDLFLQNNVPPSAIQGQVEIALQLDELGALLAPGGADADKQNAAYEYMVSFAQQTGVDISPRFGTWDPVKLALGPLPTDLATPVSGDLSIPLQPAG